MYKLPVYLLHLLFASLFPLTNLYASEMKTPETSKHFIRWTDPNSGVVSYVLKTRVAPQQQTFYFVNRSMTNDGRFLLFHCSDPPKNTDSMGVVDFKKDIVYDLPKINRFGPSPYLDTQTGDLSWATTRGLFNHSLYSQYKDVNTKLCSLPKSFPPAQHRIYRLGLHLTRSASKTKFFLDARIDNQFICGAVDIATGHYTEWGRPFPGASHAQFSPTDDNMVFICIDAWSDVVTNQYHWIPTNADGVFERLWLWKKGQEPKLIPPINGGNATHEWWGADGKGLYYCAYPKGSKGPGFGIARYDLETGQSKMITTTRATHAHCTADGRYFTFDQHIGPFYRGCPWKVFFYDSQTDNLICIETYNPPYNTAENPSTWHPDPHPNFVCNDKYIVSTLNIDGAMNLLITPVAPLIEMTR